MVAPTLTHQSGIRVPAWAIGAILAGAAVFGLGVGYGAAQSDNASRIGRVEEQNRGLDFRLCRIERALGISPYQSCYPVVSDPEPARKP